MLLTELAKLGVDLCQLCLCLSKHLLLALELAHRLSHLVTLGLHLLTDLGKCVDGSHPAAQGARRLGLARNHVGNEELVVNVLLQLVKHLLRNVLLVVFLDLHEEVRLAELALARCPVRRPVKENHHRFQGQLHKLRWLRVSLHLCNC